jgi:hypothetical protein
VRLDAGGDADEHVRPHAQLGAEPLQARDLVGAVDDDPPHPGWSATRRRSSDLLLPCRPIRAGSKPARSATVSSPSEHTSRLRPSSKTQRAMVPLRKLLPA